MYLDNTLEIYRTANKKAKTRYFSKISKGKSGLLPSLDGIIKNVDIASEVSLGLKEIPLAKIIGTNSHSRATVFSPGFLPLADPKSEFADKWMKLYQAHIEEGIRDSITVYEYLNWFFVREGNKRVSVLKYSNAFSISADVRRLIPKYNENDPSIRIYYEFLKFNQETGIFTIWFSQEGKFNDLLEYLLEYNPDLKFDIPKYRHFVTNVYNQFRSLYHKNGGGSLKITTGDAILKYIEIYGIPQKIMLSDEKHIVKLIDELKSFNKKNPDVITKPIKDIKPGIFSNIVKIFTPEKPLKIAFVHAKSSDESGWTYAHVQGKEHIDEVFGKTIQTETITNVPQNEKAYDQIKKLAEKKKDLIITTSPTFIHSTLKAALDYPKTKFLNCSENFSFKNVNTFYGRVHEPRFLLGVLAGSLTKTDSIGYIAHYPICEVISGINAFSLGVKFVNPNAVVNVKWNYKWDENSFSTKPVSELLNEGTDLICQDDLPIPGERAKGYGLYSPKYDFDLNKFVPDIHYGIIMWNWGIFYEKIIRNLINDTWKIIFDSNTNDQKRINFWWGIDSGMVDIFYSTTHVPRSTQKLIEFLRKMIIQGELNIFEGAIFDQNKKTIVKEGETASYNQILNMNWFTDNVNGTIPKKHEINGDDPLIDKLGFK